MYYRTNKIVKPGSSAQDTPPKKKHDVGLSEKERIFVHALRNLFDPKGKGKADVLQSPKGIVSQPPSTSDDRGVTHRRQTGQEKKKQENKVKRQYANEHLPPVSAIPKKWVHPASKRVKRKAGKILESEKPIGSAEKQSAGSRSSKGPVGGGSPPLIDVSRSIPTSTSSAAKHKSPSRIRRAEMRAKSLARGVITGGGRSKPVSLKQDPAVKREARENKRLGGAIDRLGEWVHPAAELEVVTAFGGADALRELCKFERRREHLVFPSVVYLGGEPDKGWTTIYVYPDGRVLSHFENCVGVVRVFYYKKSTRDYVKVTKGMRGVSLQKPRQFPALAALAKESTEAKRFDKGKSTKKNKSPSQARRLKRRAEGRSSEVAVPAEIAGVQDTVAEDVKIPFITSAGKRLADLEAELRVWEDALQKFKEGELDSNDMNKRTIVAGKIAINMANLVRDGFKEARQELAVGLAMVPPS